MILTSIVNLAVVFIVASGLTLLASQKVRYVIIALAVQYLSVFVLVATLWPMGLAAVKLVAGWMTVAILGASHLREDLQDSTLKGFPVIIFRILTGCLVGLMMFFVAPLLATWIATASQIIWAGLFLLGMGLMQLGMSTQPMRVVIGLITMLSGFEVLYAAVEASVLVAGLLAAITLGMAVTGMYMMEASRREDLK